MIVDEVTLSNISAAFPREIHVRLPATPGVYAVAGANGAGKTTFLEAMCPAALWRTWPSYGEAFASKVGQAAREGVVSLHFHTEVGAHFLDVRHDVKGAGGRGRTAALYRGMLGSAGPVLGEVDAIRDKLFPSLATVLCSVFKAQRVNRPQGFFALAPIDRKRLFVELLGLEHLQELSEAATGRAKDRDSRIAAMGNRRMQLVEQVETAYHLQTELAFARDSYVVEQGRRARASVNLLAVQDRAQVLKTEEAALRAEFAAAEQRRGQIEKAFGDLSRRASDLNQRRSTLRVRVDAAANIATDDPPAERAIRLEKELDHIETCRGVVSEQQATFDVDVRANHELKAARDSLISKIHVCQKLAAGLEELEDPQNALCQRCPLTAMARRGQQQQVAFEVELAGLLQPSETMEAEQDRLRVDADMLASRSRSVARDLQDTRELTRILSASAEAAVELAALDSEQNSIGAMHVDLAHERRSLPDNRPLVAIAQKITSATQELNEAGKAAQQAEQQFTAAFARVSRLEGELSHVAGAAAELIQLDAELAGEVDWLQAEEFVARALGPNGIQALEIDDAGPDVSRIANDLLASCYGPRFSIELATTRPTKDGQGTREVFDVRFYDNEVNRWATQASGGEMVILDEALSLALAIVNRERSGHDLRTLWRDETAGALSPENARAYLTMLRRARELGGFSHVYFVAHQPELWQGSDGFLWIEGGAVTLRDAGPAGL